jgi:hypothetical protein
LIAVAVVSVALWQVTLPVSRHDYLNPKLVLPDAGLAENLPRIGWFAGVPLLAILWSRRRDGQGIVAGSLAGLVSYGVFALIAEPSFLFGFFYLKGAIHGLILGFTAWCLTLLVSRFNTPMKLHHELTRAGRGHAHAKVPFRFADPIPGMVVYPLIPLG